MVLKLEQKSENIFSDLLAVFTEGKGQWILSGRCEGYTKDKPYIHLPIKGNHTKFFVGMEVADFPTKNFEAITKKEMRTIWEYLVKEYDFRMYSQIV